MAITKIQSESLNLADTYDFTGTVTGAGGVNTPYFSAHKTSNQDVNNSTTAKLTFDAVSSESTSGVFDLTNNKFTATEAGKYLFQFKVTFFDSANQLYRADAYFYDNGNQRRKNIFFDNAGSIREVVLTETWIQDVSVNDYFEMYVFLNTNDSGSCAIAGNASSNSKETVFSAMKIIT
jgi:hypothetical protein